MTSTSARARLRASLSTLLILGCPLSARAWQALPPATPAVRVPFEVTSTSPLANGTASASVPIRFNFSNPVKTSTIHASSFRVAGRWSGTHAGSFAFSPDLRTVVFTPTKPFSGGELVSVNLSHDVRDVHNQPLPPGGYTLQYNARAKVSGMAFSQVAAMSNTTGPQTRIYGASASDLNGDGFLDLATINEVSADVRVFLNKADGTGTFHPFQPPVPIGNEGSPNEPGDFNNDGKADLCVAASSSNQVWILRGNGAGGFSGSQAVNVGLQPHGIAVLDVDGDADLDIVNCNFSDDNLSLLLNNGLGVYGAPQFFDGGVSGEYGLVAGDMNRDGLLDLVVSGVSGQEVRTLLNQGNGTFVFAGPAQPSGGQTWVLAAGDVDGDRNLDVACANAFSFNTSVLRNTGNGQFQAPATYPIGAHTPGTELGDLDGDGDPDMVASCFGGGFWRVYRNQGGGSFTLAAQIPAPSAPSCAVLYDSDNDGDLDLALSDELADVVVLMRNQ